MWEFNLASFIPSSKVKKITYFKNNDPTDEYKASLKTIFQKNDNFGKLFTAFKYFA